MNESIELTNQEKAEPKYAPSAMFSSLLTSGSMGIVKSPEWLIKGIIEKNKVSCVFGPSGSFKSFLMLDMGLCIASGKQFHGKPTESGSVLYICGEGKEGINKRIKAWELQNNQGSPVENFFVTPMPIAINTPNGQEMLNAYLDGIKEATGSFPAKIIIDTLDRNFEGDENSSQAMSSFVDALAGIRIKTEACVTVVHHTGKGNSDSARGSNVLRSGVDTEIKVSKDDNGNIIVENTKMKDEKDGGQISMRMKIVKVGFDEKYSEDITSVVLFANVKDQEVADKVEKINAAQSSSLGLGKIQKEVLKQLMIIAEGSSQVGFEGFCEHMKSCGRNKKQTKEALSGLQSKTLVHSDGNYITIYEENYESIM